MKGGRRKFSNNSPEGLILARGHLYFDLLTSFFLLSSGVSSLLSNSFSCCQACPLFYRAFRLTVFQCRRKRPGTGVSLSLKTSAPGDGNQCLTGAIRSELPLQTPTALSQLQSEQVSTLAAYAAFPRPLT